MSPPAKPWTWASPFGCPPGWHIYAKNPGDAGLPTTVSWHPPPGATVGALIYPPHSTFDEGGLTTFGHAGCAVFTARATVPSGGTTFTVGAHVTWLACKDICIPGAADLSLTLPVTAGLPRASAETTQFPTVPPSPTAAAFGLAMAPGLALLGGLLLNPDALRLPDPGPEGPD